MTNANTHLCKQVNKSTSKMKRPNCGNLKQLNRLQQNEDPIWFNTSRAKEPTVL